MHHQMPLHGTSRSFIDLKQAQYLRTSRGALATTLVTDCVLHLQWLYISSAAALPAAAGAAVLACLSHEGVHPTAHPQQMPMLPAARTSSHNLVLAGCHWLIATEATYSCPPCSTSWVGSMLSAGNAGRW